MLWGLYAGVVLVGVVALGLVGWRVWRSARALAGELAAAERRLSEAGAPGPAGSGRQPAARAPGQRAGAAAPGRAVRG